MQKVLYFTMFMAVNHVWRIVVFAAITSILLILASPNLVDEKSETDVKGSSYFNSLGLPKQCTLEDSYNKSVKIICKFSD